MPHESVAHRCGIGIEDRLKNDERIGPPLLEVLRRHEKERRLTRGHTGKLKNFGVYQARINEGRGRSFRRREVILFVLRVDDKAMKNRSSAAGKLELTTGISSVLQEP